MQLTAAILFALLPALGYSKCYICGGSKGTDSIGQSDQESGKGNPNAGNAQGQNDCGISTFTELTQNAAQPDVGDCQQMVARLPDRSWPVNTNPQTLASYGSCCFNARTRGGTGYVGNADIEDLTNDSIRQFGGNGRVDCHGQYHMYVSGAGGMPCDEQKWYTGQQVQIDWTLTHC